MGWDSSVSHPFAAGNAVVLLVAEAAVVAEVSSCPRHIFFVKKLYYRERHDCNVKKSRRNPKFGRKHINPLASQPDFSSHTDLCNKDQINGIARSYLKAILIAYQ